MSKYEYKVFVNQLTKDGGYKYPYWSQEIGEAKFSKTFDSCMFQNRTYKKMKAGGPKGGNYLCLEDGEEYRICRY